MLGLREYLLACPAPGGVRCAKPSERLLACVFTNAEGTFPTSAIAEAEGILSLMSSRARAVRDAKPTSAPASRASSAPTPHAGQPKIADLFRLKAKDLPDGGRGAPIVNELSLTQQQQQSEVCGKSSRKCPHVEAGLSLPMMGTESQFSIPPSAESIADEQDHAQCVSKAKEARFLQTLSKKDNQIASLIAQVSELSSQITAAMQRLFQDAPGEHHSCEDAGRDRQPAGLPPVPTPVAGQTHARGLQPQQSPPAARSSRQQLQEGPYTQHQDNMTRADALPVTPARPEPRPPPLSPTSPGCISSSHNCNLHLQGTSPGASSPGCHTMSYVAAMAADKAAIADWIIGIHNRDVAPQLQREPMTYKNLYVNSYFVNHGMVRTNPYSGPKQYLYGKGVPQTIREVSFLGKGWMLAEVSIAEKDSVQAVEV
ncbi:hypothetical protein BC830DRAFT_1169299 [Chytriomyces sp. MP71]|nr:hypothetical protein BC830DRAFT_1169299 [Chytriomyces sp. MP71]